MLTRVLQEEKLLPDLVNRHIRVNDRRQLILLEEIKQNNQTIILLLQQLLAQQQRGNIETSFDEFGLPVSSMEQLLKLETDCLDNDLQGKLTRFLGQCGGTTISESTRNVMKRLMSNNVALICNWKRKGGKYAFGSCKLCQIINNAVRRNPPTCRSTDAEVACAIKAWLRFAKDRDGGRRRRNVSLE